MKGFKYFLALGSVSLAVPVNDKMIVKGNPELIKKVEEKFPEIRSMSFNPKLATLNGHITTCSHGLINRFHRIFEKTPWPFEQTLYKLSDGG